MAHGMSEHLVNRTRSLLLGDANDLDQIQILTRTGRVFADYFKHQVVLAFHQRNAPQEQSSASR